MDHAITDARRLRELLGPPMPRAVTKERTRLHAHDRAWLAASPFLLMGTANADGSCDVSPKGDPPGFVHVLSDTRIAIPERPGNRRADGYLNILANPHVGLLHLIPGRDDTLRINGRATLVEDADWFDAMVVAGHRPVLAVVVDIEQIFLHCAKAFMRSRLWDPATWTGTHAVPAMPRLVKDLQDVPETLEQLVEYYGPGYARRLYGDPPVA